MDTILLFKKLLIARYFAMIINNIIYESLN